MMELAGLSHLRIHLLIYSSTHSTLRWIGSLSAYCVPGTGELAMDKRDAVSILLELIIA